MGLGIITIGNESHLLQAECTETCCRVRLKENLIIPPQHEVRLVGMLDRPQVNSLPVKQVLLQPTASLVEETGLFMGNSLVDTSGPLVPVTLLNLDGEPKSLPRGFTVGLMEQVEGVEKGETTPPQTLEAGSEKSQIEHLLLLLDNVSDRLDGGQRERILDLVLRYQHIFSTPDAELGHTTLVDHTIDTGDSRPIKQCPRRMPPLQRELADREVDKMLEKGFIEPSDSPWASPIVLVTKKDGSTRFCKDYRRLNDVTRKDAYPLPNINETLETLYGAECFNTLDLASGYWQVPVAPADRAKTAFTTRKGLFEWKVMPFGLSNAPATFSPLMELALRGLHWERCLVYLDDIVVFGRNFEQALENLELVLDRLASAGLKLKPKKCALFQHSVKFLGHVVAKEGVSCDPEKVSCVKNWKVPECVTEVRSFLGFASYYRRFIPEFATIAAPLTKLTQKRTRFYWDEQCQGAFECLRDKLIEAPVLAYPRPEGKLILDTDASAVAISGCLSQVQDGEERVLAYYSQTLSAAQRRYCTTKRELLAVVKAVKHFCMYLWGQRACWPNGSPF